MSSTSFLLICTVFLVVQHYTFGLNCYQCGLGAAGCGPNFESKGTGVIQVVQTASGAGCAKLVYASNNNAIVRSSSSSCTATTVSASTGSDGYTSYCCTTDLCNGAPIKSVTISFTMALAALALFYII